MALPAVGIVQRSQPKPSKPLDSSRGFPHSAETYGKSLSPCHFI
ncbi:MAG: hypothetical protein V7L06_24155 [Nostoc sp.]